MRDDSALLSQMLRREANARRVFAELNNFVDLQDCLRTVAEHLRELTGCMSIAFRLHDGGDYPYFVASGFPETFLTHENSLCARDRDGLRIPCANGSGYLLECMCGNVIRGRVDPKQPFFTAGGSFFSNHTTAFLATTTEEDRQARTRNYCNSCGYESVALIPIRSKGETIGLIQLNDLRRDRFTPELIEHLETIGAHLGLAVANAWTHTKLKQALDEVKVLRGMIPICARCKKVRDDRGYWQQIEKYLSERTEAEFTHGICPDCLREMYPEFEPAPARDPA